MLVLPILESILNSRTISLKEVSSLKRLNKTTNSLLSSGHCEKIIENNVMDSIQLALLTYTKDPNNSIAWKNVLFAKHNAWDVDGTAPIEYHLFYHALSLIQINQHDHEMSITQILDLSNRSVFLNVISQEQGKLLIKNLFNVELQITNINKIEKIIATYFTHEQLVSI